MPIAISSRFAMAKSSVLNLDRRDGVEGMKINRLSLFRSGYVATSSSSGPAWRQLVTLLVGLILVPAVAYAQGRQELTVRPWWVGLELGDGQIKLTSDQFSGARNSAFALGFVGGHSLGNRVRIGLEFNGWLLQSFNTTNPAVGESVSNVLGLVDAFPIRKTPIFLRAGAGLALYQNNRPGGSNSGGWSWTAGAGYEIRLTERFGLAPIVDYAIGSLGDVRNFITMQTRRRYSVVEFRAATLWHFGRPK
jgi:Outer membrane protein beta-barrel domain